MMVNVITSIDINKSCNLVAQYAANPDNVPDWYVNIKSIEWKTPKPLQLGSQLAFRAEFLGKKLAYVYEVVDYIPEQKLVMRTADGPFSMETTYTWEAIDDQTTRMTLRNIENLPGFLPL
jgi:uncharacterized membrane protein